MTQDEYIEYIKSIYFKNYNPKNYKNIEFFIRHNQSMNMLDYVMKLMDALNDTNIDYSIKRSCNVPTNESDYTITILNDHFEAKVNSHIDGAKRHTDNCYDINRIYSYIDEYKSLLGVIREDQVNFLLENTIQNKIFDVEMLKSCNIFKPTFETYSFNDDLDKVFELLTLKDLKGEELKNAVVMWRLQR